MSKVSITIIGLNGFLGKPVLAAINSGIFDDKINFQLRQSLERNQELSMKKLNMLFLKSMKNQLRQP